MVSARHGSRVEVRTDSGTILRCRLPRRLAPIVVGDRVAVGSTEEGRGVVESVAERRTVLARPDSDGRTRLIAANVDLMFIVVALAPETSRRVFDRYLVGAEHLGISTAIVVNKVDLEETGLRGPELATYRGIGYPIFHASALTGIGIDALAAALEDRTGTLVGPSGVGKSSLVRRLVPDARLAVAELSRRGGQGRHTTTVATLHRTPGGGFVIDSPGIGDFGEWPLSAAKIADGYPEMRGYAGKCRFRNCLHLREPDCAVARAPDIDPERLASYRAMVELSIELRY